MQTKERLDKAFLRVGDRLEGPRRPQGPREDEEDRARRFLM